MRLLSLSGSRLSLLAALTVAVPALANAQGIETPRIPLRTALNEISAFRAEYESAYNKHDLPALTAMYTPDAVVIMTTGEQVMGRAAIGKMLAADSAAGTTRFESDTTRVVGHTAWEVGTMSSDKGVARYLVVLRRGLKDWQLASVAVVPEAQASKK
jgi:ketosteroid isomerase-like protein